MTTSDLDSLSAKAKNILAKYKQLAYEDFVASGKGGPTEFETEWNNNIQNLLNKAPEGYTISDLDSELNNSNLERMSTLLLQGHDRKHDLYSNEDFIKRYFNVTYGIAPEEVEVIMKSYKNDGFNFWDKNTWGNYGNSKYDFENMLNDYERALKYLEEMPEYPEMPDYITAGDNAVKEIEDEEKALEDLYTDMYKESNKSAQDSYDRLEELYKSVSNENNLAYNQLYNASQDMYNLLAENTKSELEQQLLENNAMFQDYRNQILTNNAMNNQAIAGATRYELERSQRNAISRGASAAQRLVSTINAQLGIQAQSAQQSLETSNVLAQQLLAQRQAATQLRGDYLNSQNQLSQNQLSNRNQLAQNQISNRNQLASNQASNLSNLSSLQNANRTAWSTNIANLRNGSMERKQTARANARAEAQSIYEGQQAKYNDWVSNLDIGPWGSYFGRKASRKTNDNGI